MEKQTVQTKTHEIIDYINSKDFNKNLIVYEAMEYANRILPNKIEHEYIEQFSYLVTRKILEKVENVLYAYAKDGEYLFITEEKPDYPKIRIGDIRYIPHENKMIRMELAWVSNDPRVFTFVNCDQSKFVRPMVLKLSSEQVNLATMPDQNIAENN